MVKNLLNCAKISETLKTYSAKILETLADHIDGSLSYIANVTISAIYFSLGKNDINEISGKYPHLLSIAQGNFIQNTPPDIRIETCLMMLSTLNYCISKRKDIL